MSCRYGRRAVVAAMALLSAFALANEDQMPVPETEVTGTEISDPEGQSSSGQGLDMGVPELIFQQQDEPELVAPDTASYQFYITDLESRYGPYAPGLSEQLLGLGATYQNQGLHTEAIKIFKRGVHVARVNSGLYSAEQIPLLQRLISSLVAIGDYDTADERQYYLYRVQANIYGEESPQMSLAMLERAEWERQAYYMALGDTSFMRLLTMWELYGAVLRNIARQEGSHSLSLLKPLMGLLQTQYMISSYSGESSQAAFTAGNAADTHFVEENRFSMVRVSNYKQGQAVIKAMRDVYSYNEDENSPLPAETLVLLGDWHQWHQKRDSARAIYQEAWDELAALENGEQLLASYFAEPSLLPDMPGANRDLPPPAVIRGYAEVSYNISARGRVKRLELLKLEPVDPEDDLQPVRLLRRIKQKQYRPRFVDREPAATEAITKRYAY